MIHFPGKVLAEENDFPTLQRKTTCSGWIMKLVRGKSDCCHDFDPLVVKLKANFAVFDEYNAVMKNLLICLTVLLLPATAATQSLYFPPNSGNTWDTISPQSLGWCQPKIDSLYDFLELQNTKAFIVLKDGKIVLEQYFGTHTQNDPWYWASAGKTLTAFMTGIAQQEGFLSIDDTTSQYLGTGWTSCTQAQEEKITIRDQLSMTSGLNDENLASHRVLY